jgi:hypothetical protein
MTTTTARAESETPTPWQSTKLRLFQQGLLPEVFCSYSHTTPLRSTSALGRAAVARVRTQFQYEPLLLDHNLDSLVKALERCFAYRKDIRELEVLAVKSELEYEQFKALLPVERRLDEIRHDSSLKSIERAFQQGAAQAFGEGTPLQAGFRALSDGKAGELGEDVTLTDEARSLALARWAILDKYQELYHVRHKEDGNAHNFGQRAERLLGLFEEDVAETLDRASAVRDGLRIVYGYDAGPPPETLTMASLDVFISWVRQAARRLDHLREGDVTFDIVVPLVQRWGMGGQQILSSEVFADALAEARDANGPIRLQFSIGMALIPDGSRIKGLGLAYGNDFAQIKESGIDRNATADSFGRLVVEVETPEQRGVTGAKYRRPNLILGDVGLFGGSGSSAFYRGPAVENISPIGDWTVRVHPWFVFKDGADYKASAGIFEKSLRDIKLTLAMIKPRRAD